MQKKQPYIDMAVFLSKKAVKSRKNMKKTEYVSIRKTAVERDTE